MKKILAVFLIFLISQNCFAAEMSDWAQESYINLSSSGIINSSMIRNGMTQNITREEFCKMLMVIYGQKNKVTVNDEDINIFADTNDKSIIQAYKAGIVSGKGENIFAPDDNIQRQEIAVMVSRLLEDISPDYIKFTNQIINYNKTFSDSGQTAQWAMADMSAMYHYGIITGVTENTAVPEGYATRESAVCILDRVIKNFNISMPGYTLPKVTEGTADSVYNTVSVHLSKTGEAKSHNIIIKRNGMETVTIKVLDGSDFIEGYTLEPGNDGKYIVYAEAVITDEKSVFSEPFEITASASVKENNLKEENNVISQITQESITENIFMQNPVKEEPSGKQAVTEKEKRVFPSGYYFSSESEASNNMVEVTVPVHVLRDDGTKYESTKTLTVNKALADDVISIFTEIFNDPSQFPIKDVGGYNWRKTAGGSVSEHSYGTCIDINYNENYYVTPEGTPITGSYWKPYEDPYSIAEDSIVVKTFAKYGWEWGGNAWGDSYNKDYMHFTYLGR